MSAGEIDRLLAAERSRFADLLHDGPLSGLLALRQDLEETGDRGLAPSIAALDAVIGELRDLTRAHHEDLLAGLPIAEQMRAMAQAVTAGGRVRAELALEDAELLAPHAALVRSAILELTTNAIRHGRARTIRIVTRRAPEGAVDLGVANDGHPIDLAAVAARGRDGHLGLVRLTRRAEAVGGVLTIDAAAGLVVLRLPAGQVSGAGAAAMDDIRPPATDPWLVVAADDMRYLHVSDGMSRLVGYTREELLSTPPDERPWFADRARAPGRRRAITAGTLREGHHVARVTLRHRDGQRIPALGTSHLLARRPDDPDRAFLALFRPLGRA